MLTNIIIPAIARKSNLIIDFPSMIFLPHTRFYISRIFSQFCGINPQFLNVYFYRCDHIVILLLEFISLYICFLGLVQVRVSVHLCVLHRGAQVFQQLHHSAGEQGFRTLIMRYDGDSKANDDGRLAVSKTPIIVSQFFRSRESKVYIHVQQIYVFCYMHTPITQITVIKYLCFT